MTKALLAPIAIARLLAVTLALPGAEATRCQATGSQATAESTIVLPMDLNSGNRYGAMGDPSGILAPVTALDASPQITQHVYESGPLRGHSVLALEFRRYFGVRPSLPAMRTCSLDLEVWCSTPPVPAWRTSGRLSENRGGDLTRVIDRRWVSFPAQAAVSQPPAPWSYRLSFDRPFPVVGPTWMFELRMFARQIPDPDALESMVGSDYGGNSQQGVQRFGSACPIEPNFEVLARRLMVGGPLNLNSAGLFRVSRGPMVHVFMIGLSNTSWGGLPLPLDLTPIGFPGCMLSVAPQLAFIGDRVYPGDTQMGNLQLRTPDDASLLNTTLYVQAFVGPFGWPQAPYVTSKALAITFGPPVLTIAHAFAMSPGIGIGRPTPDVGGVAPDWGLATRVEYR